MDERDITLVAAAFDRLMATLERTCDTATCWTIASAKGDILDILAGDWHGDETPTSDDDSDMTQEGYDRLADLLLDAGLPYGIGIESAVYALWE